MASQMRLLDRFCSLAYTSHDDPCIHRRSIPNMFKIHTIDLSLSTSSLDSLIHYCTTIGISKDYKKHTSIMALLKTFENRWQRQLTQRILASTQAFHSPYHGQRTHVNTSLEIYHLGNAKYPRGTLRTSMVSDIMFLVKHVLRPVDFSVLHRCYETVCGQPIPCPST